MSASKSKNNKKNTLDNGHWSFHELMRPDLYFGFVYLIWCTKTNMKYVGRKQYKHAGKKSSRNYGKETNWRTYSGSSVHLNEHINTHGEKHIRFICLGEYSCRGDLVYAEVEEQVKRDVLRARFEDGKRIYYNGQISAIKFIPPNRLSNINKKIPKEVKM